PRLGDERQMRILGKRIAQSPGNEDLPRGIGEMLLGANDMRNLHVVVVDNVGKVVKTSAVRALNDMVLLVNPFDNHVAADVIAKAASALARHLKTDDALAALRFELAPLLRRLSHPLPAVKKRTSFFLGRRTFGLYLLRRAEVVVSQSLVDERLD